MSDTDNFFRSDPDGSVVYTNRRHGYQAPELVWEFDSRLEATIPGTDKNVVFGFVRRENDADWTPTGLGPKDWTDSGPWKIKDRDTKAEPVDE